MPNKKRSKLFLNAFCFFTYIILKCNIYFDYTKIMKNIETDILVIGSGLSGLFFSLQCAKKGVNVVVVTKCLVNETATALAQGGVAAARRKPDSVKSHIEDTLRTGKGLSNKKVVEHIIKRSSQSISELEEIGVNFDKMKNGALELGREGSHSYRRIVHVQDKTGEAIENALIKKINENPNIKIIENGFCIDVDTSNKSGKKEICGAYFYKQKEPKKKKIKLKHTITVKDENIFYCSAACVAIATGGLSALYQYTVNPDISKGDGIAIAYRAGCVLRDLEFLQFHPTALYKGKSPFFLISEAVRGEGAYIVTEKKIPVMRGFKRRDLEARDVVSRRIFELIKYENIYIDFTRKEKNWIKKRFSGIFEECSLWGIDISKELIPIIPAAHYTCGGIKTNTCGETNISGLFAIGEVSSTGLHGANRLASNSLLEGVVISRNAARKALKFLSLRKNRIKSKIKKKFSVYSLDYKKSVFKKIEKRIKEIMWKKVGIVRTFEALQDGLQEINSLEKVLDGYTKSGFNIDVWNLSNSILVSKLIIRSALSRKESRGCHYMEDFPSKSEIARHTTIQKINNKLSFV